MFLTDREQSLLGVLVDKQRVEAKRAKQETKVREIGRAVWESFQVSVMRELKYLPLFG